jgi:GNAT superfamily N-acetyltransferase
MPRQDTGDRAGVVDGVGLRPATLADVDALQALIAVSARTLSAGDYTPEQVEGALRGAFGVDTQLIRDGTYFVVEERGEIVACGGWSHRRTLFGGDARRERDPASLDPATEAARIRAFFVHPRVARRGLATLILERCEADAWWHGFRRLELMATLPGVRLYAALGYEAEAPIQWQLGDGLSIEFVPMSKRLRNSPPAAGSRSRR